MSRYGHLTPRFTLIQLLISIAVVPSLSAGDELPESACRSGKFDEPEQQVSHVIDGDTIILADNRRFRLIGIDAPELGRDEAPDQPRAGEATDYLKALLRNNQDKIHIVYDRERQDNYQRNLGHLFLMDGSNIQARMLSLGLAWPLTVPPNLGFLDCYQQTAQRAIDTRTGLWSHPHYRPRPSSALTGSERGYHVVTGTISRIGNSRSSVWLNLGDNLAIRIVKQDLVYFANLDIYRLAGSGIEVRGILYQRNGRLRTRIRHPVDIRFLDDN